MRIVVWGGGGGGAGTFNSDNFLNSNIFYNNWKEQKHEKIQFFVPWSRLLQSRGQDPNYRIYYFRFPRDIRSFCHLNVYWLTWAYCGKNLLTRARYIKYWSFKGSIHVPYEAVMLRFLKLYVFVILPTWIYIVLKYCRCFLDFESRRNDFSFTDWLSFKIIIEYTESTWNDYE